MTRFSRLIESIGQQRDKVIEYQTRMTELPALGPENGGTGEMPKALYLEGLLRELGVTDILRIDAPDSRVPDGVRPNVIARIPGASPRRLWILGHMDVVPPGELSYWKTDPWKVVVDGDKIRGRGVEDNQQAIVCCLLIAQELKAQGITPDLSLGLIFVSDEETSSRYGIHYILKTHADLFGPDDFVVVPDYGVADGSSIEISEKGQLWMRVEVLGHQCHASRPQEGRNSLVAAADMILHVRDLESIYAQVDPAVPAPVLHVRPDAPRRERPQYQFPAGQGRVLHRLPHSAGHQPRRRARLRPGDYGSRGGASWRDRGYHHGDQCARVARNPARQRSGAPPVRRYP